ncbi:MAG: ion channel [Planctomycetota bacterium]
MRRSPLSRIRRGAITLAAIFLVSVAGFRLLGEYTWLESVWLVVVTISTVGYAESPQGGSGLQILMILCIVLGVSASVYTCGGLI